MQDQDEEWSALPLLLTVDEAARVLRIGRSHAYNLTKQYETSGGTTGVPVIRLGDLLRVPKSALQELLTTGRVVQLTSAPAPSAPRRTTANVRRSADLQQLSLLATD